MRQYKPEISCDNEIPGVLTKRGLYYEPPKGPHLGPESQKILETALQFACDALIACERQLNLIDSERSGGNVGTRLKKAAQNVTKKLKKQKLQTTSPYSLLKSLSVILEMSIGGVMGSMYGLFLESAANVFGKMGDNDVITPLDWLKALSEGTESLKRYCIGDMQFQTMFYPISGCEGSIARELKGSNYDFLTCFNTGVGVAEERAQMTTPSDGKFPDAGAHAVGIWMRALIEGVKVFSCASQNKQDPNKSDSM